MWQSLCCASHNDWTPPTVFSTVHHFFFGKTQVERIPYAQTFGVGDLDKNKKTTTTIGDYIASWAGYERTDGGNDTAGLPATVPKYLFDAAIIDRHPLLAQEAQVLLDFLNERHVVPVSKQFFLGPSFSGSPFHFHGEAANFQVCLSYQ